MRRVATWQECHKVLVELESLKAGGRALLQNYSIGNATKGGKAGGKGKDPKGKGKGKKGKDGKGGKLSQHASIPGAETRDRVCFRYIKGTCGKAQADCQYRHTDHPTKAER